MLMVIRYDIPMLSPKDVDLVIAHGQCPDGFGAAWSAWSMHGDEIEYYFPVHKREIDISEVPDVTGKNVLMVDFAYSNIDFMNELNQKANNMLVLDHHKQNRDDLEGKIDCDHIFDMNRSGARMAWDFFYPGLEPPLLIKYIEDGDLWRWKHAGSRDFLAAMNSYPQTFENYEWISLLHGNSLTNFFNEGAAIRRYRDNVVAKMVEMAVPGDFITPDGQRHLCFAVNCPSKDIVSDVGNKLAYHNIISFMWGYEHGEKEYFASLRSVGEIDVAAIAKQFGGGGHLNASGFSFSGQISDVFLPYDKKMSKRFQSIIDKNLSLP